MKTLKVTVLAVAAAALMSGAALAADMPDPPMLEDNFTTDSSVWDGAYIGASFGSYGGGYYDVDLVGGFNFTVLDSFVLGVEGGVGAYFGGSSGFEAYIAGRGGIALESALIYGTVGTYIYDGGSTSPFVGAGVEFMASDDLSIRVQGLTFGGSDYLVSAGVFWHL